MGFFKDLVAGLPDTVLGGLGSWVSNAINYAYQQKAADYNYQLSEKSAENQYNRQLDFWGKQNAYNHPQAQVNRRLSAGLAPTENIDSGNASQLSSVPGNNVGLNGALNFQSSFDLLGAMRNINEIRNLGKTGNQIDQQISNLIIEGILMQTEDKLKNAGLEELSKRVKLMKEQIRGESLKNDRYKKENENLYTPEYYKDVAQQMKAVLQEFKDKHQGFLLSKPGIEWNNQLISDWGITPEMLTTLISAGGNLVGDLIGVGGDILRGKFGPKSKFFNRKSK